MDASRPRRSMERRTPVWQAPRAVLDLMGDTPGKALNGWGETTERPPTVVMWARPDRLVHGRVQATMTEEFLAHPELRASLRTDDRHDPAPIAEQRCDLDPAGWVEEVTNFATGPAGESVELVGVAAIRPNWWFEGRERDYPWIIVLGVVMDHARLATAPEYTSALEVHAQYNRGTRAARALADHIRGLGYRAEGHGGPGAGPILMVPAAIEAGFGELGKHGSIINRHFGSSFRLAAVLTDAPLVASPADEFGAADFCRGCRVCTDACPPNAISPETRMVRGTRKWAVDFDRCLPYFATSYGCGICIAACPWSRPGAAPRLAANMTRKRARRLSPTGADPASPGSGRTSPPAETGDRSG